MSIQAVHIYDAAVSLRERIAAPQLADLAERVRRSENVCDRLAAEVTAEAVTPRKRCATPHPRGSAVALAIGWAGLRG